MFKPIVSRQSEINQSYNWQSNEYTGKPGAMPKSHEKQMKGNSIYFASRKEQSDKMLVSEKEQELIDRYAKSVRTGDERLGKKCKEYQGVYNTLTQGTMTPNDVREVIKLLEIVKEDQIYRSPPQRSRVSRFDEKPTVAEMEKEQVDKKLADVIKRSQQTGDEYAQVMEESRLGYSLDQNPPPTTIQQPSRTTPYGETPYIDMETTPRKKLEFTPQPRIPEPYDSEVPQDLQNMDSINREQPSGIVVNKVTEEDLKYRERQSAANTLNRFMNEERVLSSSSNSAFSDLGTGDIYDGRQEVKDLQNSNQYAKAPAKPYVSEVYNERTGSGMRPTRFVEIGESKKDPNMSYWGGGLINPTRTNPTRTNPTSGKTKTREQLLIDQANQEQSSRRSNIYPQIEGVSLPNYSSGSSSSSSSENKPVTSRADLIDKAVRLGDYVNRGIATLTTIRNANEGDGEGGGMFQEIANRANLSADRNEEKKQDGLYGSKGSLFNQDVSNPRLLKERFEMGEQKVKNKFGKVNKYINMKNKSMLASQLLGQGVAAPSLKDLRGSVVEYNQPSSSLKGNAVNLIRRGNATALMMNNEYMP